MRLCNSELIKKVNELRDKKAKLLTNERNRCKIKYKDGEKKVDVAYSYGKTREQIDKIDDEIRRLKNLVAKANCTAVVEDFEVSIGEALVLLAQMNEKLSVLERLASDQQLTRATTYGGVVEYEECLYDVEKVDLSAEQLRSKIAKLQIAIDRANLNTYSEL